MDEALYDEFSRLERQHWWFVARQRIFIRLIKQYLAQNKPSRILDIGCGTGMNMEYLADLGEVFGIDLSMDALRYCLKMDYPLCLLV